MSIKVMNAVWQDGPRDQGMLLVLLAMADFADDAGVCWPAMDTIAKKARMSERNARRVVRKLEDFGYLETDENRGRNATNRYTIRPLGIKPDNLSAQNKTGQMEHENRTSATLKPDICDIKPDTAMSAEPSRTIKEPSENHQRARDFEEFWSIVPRKKGKGAARTAYDKARRKTDSATLFSAMSLYAETREGKDPQYTVHPTTWLNQERWLDEPDQKPRNFHDKLDEALNGLRKPDSIDFSEAQRLSAPVQDARSPDGRGGASTGESNGGGNQQAVASVIRPRRFGGSAW